MLNMNIRNFSTVDVRGWREDVDDSMAKKQNTEDTVAVKAGKAAGSAVASADSPQPAKAKKGKLPKKNKSRLPRRQKKALQKAANQKPG